MRKFTALLLTFILLTLSACTGAENYTPTPTPRPTVTRSPLFPPTPTPPPPAEPIQYEPVDVPDYYPPLDFEVESVWRAEPFGDRGDAVLYLSKETDGEFAFRVYFYQYVRTEVKPLEGAVMRAFYATAIYNGKNYEFSLAKERAGTTIDEEAGEIIEGNFPSIPYTSDMGGQLNFTGDRITLSYTAEPVDSSGDRAEFHFSEKSPYFVLDPKDTDSGARWIEYCPTEFKRVNDEEAGKVMYEMPLYDDEIVLPEYGPETAQYYNFEVITSFDSDNPACIPMLRGIKIGDTYADIVARFPCHGAEKEDVYTLSVEPTESNETVFMLYGNYIHGLYDGMLHIENNIPTSVSFSSFWWITYGLDDNLRVDRIRTGTLI